MAIIGISIGFSFYLALLLGPIIAGKFGLSGIFLMTGVLACLCVFLVLFVVPNAKNIAPKGDTLPVIDDLKGLFLHPQLLRLNISVLLLHMLITLLFVQVPVFLIDLNWPLATHWKAYSVVLVASVIGLIGLMALAAKRKQEIMQFSVAGLAVVFTLLIFSQHSIIYLMLLVSLFFTCFNYLEANFPAMVSNIAPAGKKGSAMGVYASFQFFGAFIGGLLSGTIGELLGIQWVFILASVLCCGWLWLITGLHATQKLKRYTLRINEQTSDLAFQQLSELEGVVDITIVPNEQVMYLKAEQHFDIQQARLVLNLKD
jgi:MFS family permease